MPGSPTLSLETRTDAPKVAAWAVPGVASTTVVVIAAVPASKVMGRVRRFIEPPGRSRAPPVGGALLGQRAGGRMVAGEFVPKFGNDPTTNGGIRCGRMLGRT